MRLNAFYAKIRKTMLTKLSNCGIHTMVNFLNFNSNEQNKLRNLGANYDSITSKLYIHRHQNKDGKFNKWIKTY